MNGLHVKLAAAVAELLDTIFSVASAGIQMILSGIGHLLSPAAIMELSKNILTKNYLLRYNVDTVESDTTPSSFGERVRGRSARNGPCVLIDFVQHLPPLVASANGCGAVPGGTALALCQVRLI